MHAVGSDLDTAIQEFVEQVGSGLCPPNWHMVLFIPNKDYVRAIVIDPGADTPDGPETLDLIWAVSDMASTLDALAAGFVAGTGDGARVDIERVGAARVESYIVRMSVDRGPDEWEFMMVAGKHSGPYPRGSE